MQISFPHINNIKNITFNNRPAFRGIKNDSPCDTFVRSTSSLRTVKLGNGEITGIHVKDVMFDDRKGGKVPGFIIRDSKNENQYFACVNGNAECRMVMFDEKDEGHIYLAELYGQNNHGSVKGAGTELVKFAAETSKQKGYNGRVQLKMGGSFPFHYKNNFRVPERYTFAKPMNAALDYITRTGQQLTQYWPDWNANVLADLDEKGAEMLLNGERLTDKSKSQVLYTTEIESKKGIKKEYDMDFCDFGDKFAIQMMKKNARTLGQAVVMTGEIKDGKLIPDEELYDDWGYGELESVQEEFKKALEIAQQKYNE